MAVEQKKLENFLHKAVGDLGATVSAALVVTGDRLGLYKAMANAGPLSVVELARKTGTVERYIREWLLNQAASGIVEYDAASDRYTLPEEQALVFAVEDSPVFLPGAYQLMLGMVAGEEKVRPHFKGGGGIGYAELHPGVHEGVDRFFRPGYLANLLPTWIPSLDGVQAKLQEGARVADVGCGQGTATRILAEAFPKSTFVGFDPFGPSIEAAARRGKGVRNLRFEEGLSTNFPGQEYDLVTFFDCLHDMADPIGAARHVRSTLNTDGTWLIVEPRAGDTVAENLNPVGRVYSACSVLYCLTTCLSQKGAGLGAQAGEGRIRDVARQGGLTRFRRASETPFNLVYEARP